MKRLSQVRRNRVTANPAPHQETEANPIAATLKFFDREVRNNLDDPLPYLAKVAAEAIRTYMKAYEQLEKQKPDWLRKEQQT